MPITIKVLMESGKNGVSGLTATPLARVLRNSVLENVQLPCSEATTVLATKLRRRHAQVLKVSIITYTRPGKTPNNFTILQALSQNGKSGASGLHAQPLADLGPKSELEHAVNQLLREMSNVLEILMSLRIVHYLSVQVNFYI